VKRFWNETLLPFLVFAAIIGAGFALIVLFMWGMTHP
jgi:uncharacterized protein (DUF2062 family)